jgi:hypothetical protein
LVALIVLSDFHAMCFKYQAALGHLHFAGEGGELLLIVVLERVGLNVHGFVAVCFFGVSACHREDGDQTTEQKKGEGFHKGANLA